MAVVTAAVAEAVGSLALAAVEVSTESAGFSGGFRGLAVMGAVAYHGGAPGFSGRGSSRGLVLIPVPQAVQVPDIHGLGKVTVAATHPRYGISSHPATPGL